LALELEARDAARPIDDYACTLLVVILSANGGIVGQIGDGAEVIDDGERGWRPVHGEYANTTHFLTEPDGLHISYAAIILSDLASCLMSAVASAILRAKPMNVLSSQSCLRTTK
jgi:Protein phosphatase 2C